MSANHRNTQTLGGQTQGPISVRPHPLEPLALGLLRDHENLTSDRLAELLGGHAAHHKKLAGEILASMLARGTAWRNDAGQFRHGENHRPLSPAMDEILAWEATPRPFPVRPESLLSVQLETRRYCRVGLPGLRVALGDLVMTIDHTGWDVHSELVIYFKDAIGPLPVDGLVLLDPWPARCCRPTKARLRKAIEAARKDGRT